VWGTLPPAAAEAEARIASFFRAEPKSIAFVVDDNPFALDLMETGALFAIDSGIEVLAEIVGPTIPDEEQLLVAAIELKELQPDVIFSSVEDCAVQDSVMRRLDYLPPGLTSQACSDPLVDDRYFIVAQIWDVRFRGSSYTEDESVQPSLFYEDGRAAPAVYVKRLTERFPDFQIAVGTAFHMAAATILANAIWRADSVEPVVVNTFVSQTVYNGVFGKIQYGPTGKMEGHPMGGAQKNRTYQSEIVIPAASRTANLVYPIPQYDQRVFEQSWYSSAAEIAVAVVAGVAILVSLCLTLLVAVQWHRPVWVAAQRIFLMVLLLGTIFVYCSTYVWTLYATDATCTSMTWLLSLGLVIIVAVLLAKTWRVFRVFMNKKFVMVTITNAYLLAMVSGLLVVPLVLLIVWTALGGLQAELKVVSADTLTDNYMECYAGTTDIVFISLMAGYIALMVLACSVLAYRVRKVSWMGLGDM
jgi:7 transmembrane sweet-taste receptor of 3 GCPR